MNNITKTAESHVILESEWPQHRLHQQRLRWAELGQKLGKHIEVFAKSRVIEGSEKNQAFACLN